MAPSKKTSNGRSPLVNQQRQITAFFVKKPETSSSPSPSPSPLISKQKPKLNSSPSPITPSPFDSKRKKPVLVVGPNLSPSPENPSSHKKSYGAEVVNRRIKVYWPLDKSWYEGCVKSFDKVSGKHWVQYDDADEEMINLSEENIEWIEEPAKKIFRRLRRSSVVEDEDEETEGDVKELEDDSDDEDWGNNTEKEAMEDDDGSEDIDLVEEEESGGGFRKKTESRKRKVKEGEQTGPMASKKNKIGGKLNNSVSKVPFAVSGGKPIESTIKITSADSK